MSAKEYNKAKKAFCYLIDIGVMRMFELPSESGHWERLGDPDEDGNIAVGRYGARTTSRRLPKSTTVIIDYPPQ